MQSCLDDMTAAVNLPVISVLMHIETMQLYQAHYVGCVKHEQYRDRVRCPAAH